MKTIDMKDIVERAIQADWARFAQDHPRLAAAIDRQVLVEEATRALSDDPQFLQALARASAAGVLSESVVDLVLPLVSQWLRRLI